MASHRDRIKEGLAAAKARGTKLGGWRGGPPPDPERGRQVQGERADALARLLGPEIRHWYDRDLSYRALADSFNRRGMGTPRGQRWTPTAVRRVLVRFEELGGARLVQHPSLYVIPDNMDQTAFRRI